MDSSSNASPSAALHGANLGAEPSAALDWRRIPGITSSLRDSFTARARRLATELNGFVRATRLDGVEAEIVAAQADLRELRIHVRQMRADAKAEQRTARSIA